MSNVSARSRTVLIAAHALRRKNEGDKPPQPAIGREAANPTLPYVPAAKANARVRNRLLIEDPNNSGTAFGTAWRFKQHLNY
jgi:hypothetical protein